MEAVALWGAGIGLSVVLYIAGKRLPKLLTKYTSRLVDEALEAGDDDLDEVIYALCKYAEKKIPDKGKGAEKYALVAGAVSSALPIMKDKPKKLAKLIQKSARAVDDELKKKLKNRPK